MLQFNEFFKKRYSADIQEAELMMETTGSKSTAEILKLPLNATKQQKIERWKFFMNIYHPDKGGTGDPKIMAYLEKIWQRIKDEKDEEPPIKAERPSPYEQTLIPGTYIEPQKFIQKPPKENRRPLDPFVSKHGPQ